MAHRGVDPKPARLGHSSNADWQDVPDVPYAGPWPVELPAKNGRSKWHPQVVAWWEEVRVMPHCVLWSPTDWRFALDTAYMKHQLWVDYGEGEMKSTAWTEVRRREDQMGYTVEARRKLRIRYVKQDVKRAASPVAAVPGGQVVSIDDRRNRLTG